MIREYSCNNVTGSTICRFCVPYRFQVLYQEINSRFFIGGHAPGSLLQVLYQDAGSRFFIRIQVVGYVSGLFTLSGYKFQFQVLYEYRFQNLLQYTYRDSRFYFRMQVLGSLSVYKLQDLYLDYLLYQDTSSRFYIRIQVPGSISGYKLQDMYQDYLPYQDTSSRFYIRIQVLGSVSELCTISRYRIQVLYQNTRLYNNRERLFIQTPIYLVQYICIPGVNGSEYS